MIKRVLIVVVIAIFMAACSEGDKKIILSDSVGNINSVKVVLDKDQWQGKVGDAIREILADPVYGLPREEPKFAIDQIPTTAFKDFLRKNRIFVQIKKADSATVNIVKDIYAQPQTGVIITGNTSLASTFGVRINFPNAYRYAMQEDAMFWMRKDLKRNGNMNIIVYEVPYRVIDKDTLTIKNIIRMRDSIGGKMIPVDDGRFITERAFAPFLQETTINNKFAYETKGVWEVSGRYMAGPFVNYAIRDEENERYIILEGFIFSPSQDQRDNMFELESILKTAKLK